ncbi:MAG: Phospholipid-binding protein, PBP family [Candidatus Moranbacteria bacterium GW2011_GWE1_49_15]|nr:MAG: Phospholipid-binding protein, PBP family [Candidatus Moranbacteria bacterium GW2011_GWE2_47_10]KKW05480.1 MAG: Phospholipid-binding protein, PBP family [Candidatus Moranbacteria bacterium GW2011_GWE1_49_15]HBP01227.1 YbhB/YbcL family Raf kinase inhibitor-like protein [Candidatus Moranbacteria bacterium]
MKITSPLFSDGESIPQRYTCDGEDINPPLNISGDIQPGTRSLALTVFDSDAPGKGWVHWMLWNMEPETKAIGENSVPAGAAQGMTDFGRPGYGGPCPPSGTHRYEFRLYALDAMLDIPETSTMKDLQMAMDGHVLDQAVLVGLYSRQ